MQPDGAGRAVGAAGGHVAVLTADLGREEHGTATVLPGQVSLAGATVHLSCQVSGLAWSWWRRWGDM